MILFILNYPQTGPEKELLDAVSPGVERWRMEAFGEEYCLFLAAGWFEFQEV